MNGVGDAGAVSGSGWRVWPVVAGVLGVALAVLLLWPDGEAVRQVILRIYLFGLERGVPSRIGPEVYATVLNVLAFVPVAWLGVAVLHRRPTTVVLVLVALSALAELVQVSPWLGRDPSLLDVACNAAGAVVGAVLGSRGRGAPDELDDTGLDEPGDERLDPGPHRRG